MAYLEFPRPVAIYCLINAAVFLFILGPRTSAKEILPPLPIARAQVKATTLLLLTTAPTLLWTLSTKRYRARAWSALSGASRHWASWAMGR